ncbi:hypothetical protein HYS50_01085 [Candidatus Woesearchaeota archaeon]|nr:hypothetical protein [Candidatus Woesearchaeota archaeon]
MAKCKRCGIWEATFYGKPSPDGICGTCKAESIFRLAEPTEEEKRLAGLK